MRSAPPQGVVCPDRRADGEIGPWLRSHDDLWEARRASVMPIATAHRPAIARTPKLPTFLPYSTVPVTQPPAVSLNLGLYLNAPIPIAELCEKSSDWVFEQEVRVPKALSDCQKSGPNPRNSNYPVFITEVPPECIKRVILGERFDEEETFRISRLAEDADVLVARSFVNHWDYNLELFETAYKKGGKTINPLVLRNPRDFPGL